MKPSAKREFPIIDCNYQEFSLDRRFGGSSPDSESSFLNISREYFRYEARWNFLAEAAYFLVLTVILAVTLITGAIIVIRFLNLLES